MSDIAERLKKLATAQTIAPSSVYANICGEAASFIESQRGALRGADQRITSLEADNARLGAALLECAKRRMGIAAEALLPSEGIDDDE